jgi:D-alanyl-D-alanine dipeptidase
MTSISRTDLIPFSLFTESFPLRVDPVYAKEGHPENVFGALYQEKAVISGHRDMVALVLLAALRLFAEAGWTLVVKDCLRPVEAQEKMLQTPIVKANPHWLDEPRFLSPPGKGGHPRGMAVDLAADGPDGAAINFGTPFDHFAASPAPEINPAHREHPNLPEPVQKNRGILERAMTQAAIDLGLPLLPLPQEWWDFRFPASYSSAYAPLSDADLPPFLKVMTEPSPIPEGEKLRMRESVLARLTPLCPEIRRVR